MEPLMCWNSDTLVESFKLFKQRCELYFSAKGIDESKQVNYILLLSGNEGLRRYNSWSFANEADKCNPAVIWEKFQEQIDPEINFRIARFCLQKSLQTYTENIDDFFSRCMQQAEKCKFRDQLETEERIIEQIIAGTKFPELQMQLLRKNENMSMSEVLNMCRRYEASVDYVEKNWRKKKRVNLKSK